MPGHVVSMRLYLVIFITLLFLTALTTAVAYVDLGVMNTVVAMLIAVIKMSLVVLFFMHVKYSSGLIRVVVVAGIFWLAIMITFTMADELTRQWTGSPHGWGPAISSSQKP
jgi:cytochrome c oxidase subunit IV